MDPSGGMDPSCGMDQNSEYSFFKNTKKIKVRICNPTIFALHTLGVKLSLFPHEMTI